MPFLRVFMVAAVVVQGCLAAAFIFRLPLAQAIWPLPYTSQLSFIFLGSIMAAAAASTSWCLVVRAYGALTGIALDAATIFTPLSIFGFQLAATSSGDAARNFGIVSVFTAISAVGLLLWSLRIPIPSAPPLPPLVRWSFVFFVVALLLTGSALILGKTDVLPWAISESGAVIYGWIFLGAASYFGYGVLRPSWYNAGGQLAGFLAYDLVLIVPFLRMLPTIEPARRLGLILYTGVLVYSGLLAIYYLFIHPKTRVFRPDPAA